MLPNLPVRQAVVARITIRGVLVLESTRRKIIVRSLSRKIPVIQVMRIRGINPLSALDPQVSSQQEGMQLRLPSMVRVLGNGDLINTKKGKPGRTEVSVNASCRFLGCQYTHYRCLQGERDIALMLAKNQRTSYYDYTTDRSIN